MAGCVLHCCESHVPNQWSSVEGRKAYTNEIMVKDRNIEHSSSSEICAGVKKLGFAAFERVRLYGEEFELLSDPFPEADGIAIRVKSKRDARLRTVQLPATIVQSVRSRKAA